jgi:hypothetical protein
MSSCECSISLHGALQDSIFNVEIPDGNACYAFVILWALKILHKLMIDMNKIHIDLTLDWKTTLFIVASNCGSRSSKYDGLLCCQFTPF